MEFLNIFQEFSIHIQGVWRWKTYILSCVLLIDDAEVPVNVSRHGVSLKQTAGNINIFSMGYFCKTVFEIVEYKDLDENSSYV